MIASSIDEISYTPADSHPSVIDYSKIGIHNPEVAGDYVLLNNQLSVLTEDTDTSKMKIVGLIHDSDRYHPLAVMMAAKDYGFMIEVCTGLTAVAPGHTRSCRRFRANGVWVILPEDLEDEINKSYKNISYLFCDGCLADFKERNKKLLE